jgi:hypothetical protein
VHVKAKATVPSKPEYDALVVAQLKGPTSAASDRPTSSVVRTVDEPAPGPAAAATPAKK